MLTPRFVTRDGTPVVFLYSTLNLQTTFSLSLFPAPRGPTSVSKLDYTNGTYVVSWHPPNPSNFNSISYTVYRCLGKQSQCNVCLYLLLFNPWCLMCIQCLLYFEHFNLVSLLKYYPTHYRLQPAYSLIFTSTYTYYFIHLPFPSCCLFL